MRVLVTEGAGFIGSNVVRHMLGQGALADNSRVREPFPAVQPVDLTDGLAKIIDWFRSEATERHHT